jgi:hypothetical protein
LPDNFLERYKRIRVGGIVRIKNQCLPPNHILHGVTPVHSDFVDYIVKNENEFTIIAIQEYFNNVLISIFELKHVLEYYQIATISKRVLNWHKGR